MNADQSPVAESTTASGKRQAAMPFIMATVLIDMISIGLIIPVLPKLVGSFEATPAEQVGAYAWVAMAFGFANFIAWALEKFTPLNLTFKSELPVNLAALLIVGGLTVMTGWVASHRILGQKPLEVLREE